MKLKPIYAQIGFTLLIAAVLLGAGYLAQRLLYVTHASARPAVRVTLPRSWVQETLDGLPAGADIVRYTPKGKTMPWLQIMTSGQAAKATEATERQTIIASYAQVAGKPKPTVISFDGQQVIRTEVTVSPSPTIVEYVRPLVGSQLRSVATARVPLTDDARWQPTILRALSSLRPQ